MTAICSLDDIHRTFKEHGRTTPVLRGVSFDVNEGEFLCVMGPSGSGKSTLLHLLSGLDRPTAGRVVLAGCDMEKLSTQEKTLHRRRTVAHVFQFFNLMPNLTVRENVGLPLAIAGENPDKKSHDIEKLLSQFGLTGRMDARPHQLSGGEMQRTSIARALAGGQSILLCDEPTGNLSQRAGREVMEHLQRVAKELGRTILLVTHNPRDATYADRVLFMVDGRLDPAQELRGPNLSVDDIHQALVQQGI